MLDHMTAEPTSKATAIHGLNAIRHLELREKVLQVPLDSLGTDAEATTDFLVAHPAADELEDFALAIAERPDGAGGVVQGRRHDNVDFGRFGEQLQIRRTWTGVAATRDGGHQLCNVLTRVAVCLTQPQTLADCEGLRESRNGFVAASEVMKRLRQHQQSLGPQWCRAIRSVAFDRLGDLHRAFRSDACARSLI